MEQDPTGSTLEWSVHPVKENLRISLLVILFLVAVWVGTYIAFHDAIWVILAILFLGGSLLPFFTVTSYRMDDSGVTIRRPLTKVVREWARVRSFYPDRKGVLLSPFARPSRLENFRGVYVRFGSNREQILHLLKQRVPSSDAAETG